MTAKPYRTRNGTKTVTAVQVPDELSTVARIAAWVYDQGGKLTDPMTTFDCAFRLHVDGEMVPVNVGDWVMRHRNGAFAVAPDDEFDGVFEEEAVARG